MLTIFEREQSVSGFWIMLRISIWMGNYVVDLVTGIYIFYFFAFGCLDIIEFP